MPDPRRPNIHNAGKSFLTERGLDDLEESIPLLKRASRDMAVSDIELDASGMLTTRNADGDVLQMQEVGDTIAGQTRYFVEQDFYRRYEQGRVIECDSGSCDYRPGQSEVMLRVSMLCSDGRIIRASITTNSWKVITSG